MLPDMNLVRETVSFFAGRHDTKDLMLPSIPGPDLSQEHNVGMGEEASASLPVLFFLSSGESKNVPTVISA